MKTSQMRLEAMAPFNRVKEYHIVFDTEVEAQRTINLLQYLEIQKRAKHKIEPVKSTKINDKSICIVCLTKFNENNLIVCHNCGERICPKCGDELCSIEEYTA